MSDPRIVDKLAGAAVRRHLLPLFRDVGFDRVTGAVCERWCGDDPSRPWQYIRFHLSREGRAATDPAIGFLPELHVHYPSLDSPAIRPRVDRSGRYSPRLAEVFIPRHTLVLAHSTKHPAWRGCADTIEARLEEMAGQVAQLLVPAITRFNDSRHVEIELQEERALLTPDAVRAKVDDELAHLAALKASGRQLGVHYPDDPVDFYKLHWTVQATPACYANPRLRRVTSNRGAVDRYSAALAEQARSLHYTSDYAAHHGFPGEARTFERLALEMETATGVELAPYA